MIPFAPDIRLTNALLGGTNAEFGGKELARTLIGGDRMLSVPIVGGSARLRHARHDFSLILISDHGRWRQEHLGAWNAIYGKTPFFPHIFPQMEKVYLEKSHSTLREFNESLFEIVTTFLSPEELMPDIRHLKNSKPVRYAEIKEEIERKVNLNYSIFDAIFRLGRNSIWICSGD